MRPAAFGELRDLAGRNGDVRTRCEHFRDCGCSIRPQTGQPDTDLAAN
jgi:hypothetical protein